MTSPMEPQRIDFFEEKGLELADVVAGNSWTLFRTKDGRVYGAGNFTCGQLTSWHTGIAQQDVARPDAEIKPGERRRKLMRIDHIATLSEMALYVTNKGELFIKGSIGEVGFVDAQHRIIQVPTPEKATPLRLRGIKSGASSALLYTEDDQLYAYGVTIEGQMGVSVETVAEPVTRKPVLVSSKWEAAKADARADRWRESIAPGLGFMAVLPPYPEFTGKLRESTWPPNRDGDRI
eukprot:PhM_4_TR11951/c0_g1_i1/m.87321